MGTPAWSRNLRCHPDTSLASSSPSSPSPPWLPRPFPPGWWRLEPRIIPTHMMVPSSWARASFLLTLRTYSQFRRRILRLRLCHQTAGLHMEHLHSEDPQGMAMERLAMDHRAQDMAMGHLLMAHQAQDMAQDMAIGHLLMAHQAQDMAQDMAMEPQDMAMGKGFDLISHK